MIRDSVTAFTAIRVGICRYNGDKNARLFQPAKKRLSCKVHRRVSGRTFRASAIEALKPRIRCQEGVLKSSGFASLNIPGSGNSVTDGFYWSFLVWRLPVGRT